MSNFCAVLTTFRVRFVASKEREREREFERQQRERREKKAAKREESGLLSVGKKKRKKTRERDVIIYAQRFQVNLHFLRRAHSLSHTHAHFFLSVSLSVCVLCVPFSRFFTLLACVVVDFRGKRSLFLSLELWGKKRKSCLSTNCKNPK
jgi:Flp pilus assembly protein TadB